MCNQHQKSETETTKGKMSTNYTSTVHNLTVDNNNNNNNEFSTSVKSSSRDGPCGACKFLRRKCIRGCVFAPYFDSDQGTAHFAAVHRVFGASNASKLLMRLPPHRRLEAVVTMCYEALARVRDPVYGCVAHIFTLQQQVVNLQAELAYIQARISTLQQHGPFHSPQPNYNYSTSQMTLIDISSHSYEKSQNMGCFDLQELEEADLGQSILAREYVSKYFPGVRFRNSTPP